MTPPKGTHSKWDPVDLGMFATTVQSALCHGLDKFFVPLGFPRVAGVTVFNHGTNVQVQFENGQTFDMHIRQLGR